MSTCTPCTLSNARPRGLSGRYNLTCLQCCTRLVLSAQPNKQQAAVMLAAIARQPGAPSRQQVLSCVEQSLSRLRLAQAKSNTACEPELFG